MEKEANLPISPAAAEATHGAAATNKMNTQAILA